MITPPCLPACLASSGDVRPAPLSCRWVVGPTYLRLVGHGDEAVALTDGRALVRDHLGRQHLQQPGMHADNAPASQSASSPQLQPKLLHACLLPLPVCVGCPTCA